MSFKSVCFLLVSNFIFITTALASQGGESHGGDGVACFDRPYFLEKGRIDPKAKMVTTPRLKDFWEFSQLLDFKLIQPNDPRFSKLNYQEIFEIIVHEISTKDPITADKLRKMFLNSNRYFKFVDQTVLTEINDSDSIIRPDPAAFCYEIQLAAFRKDVVPGASYSVINRTIFNRLPEIDKAGLILHEIFWFYLMEKKTNETNLSQYVRHYTYLVFTDDLFSKPFSAYYYMKNMVLSGIHAFLPAQGTYLINGHYYTLKIPGRYTLSHAAKVKLVQLKFADGREFYLPQEIWEPEVYKPIQALQHFNYELCISLEYDDFKTHGPCPR